MRRVLSGETREMKRVERETMARMRRVAQRSRRRIEMGFRWMGTKETK
jgi:hypothetical protein